MNYSKFPKNHSRTYHDQHKHSKSTSSQHLTQLQSNTHNTTMDPNAPSFYSTNSKEHQAQHLLQQIKAKETALEMIKSLQTTSLQSQRKNNISNKLTSELFQLRSQYSQITEPAPKLCGSVTLDTILENGSDDECEDLDDQHAFDGFDTESVVSARSASQSSSHSAIFSAMNPNSMEVQAHDLLGQVKAKEMEMQKAYQALEYMENTTPKKPLEFQKQCNVFNEINAELVGLKTELQLFTVAITLNNINQAQNLLPTTTIIPTQQQQTHNIILVNDDWRSHIETTLDKLMHIGHNRETLKNNIVATIRTYSMDKQDITMLLNFIINHGMRQNILCNSLCKYYIILCFDTIQSVPSLGMFKPFSEWIPLHKRQCIFHWFITHLWDSLFVKFHSFQQHISVCGDSMKTCKTEIKYIVIAIAEYYILIDIGFGKRIFDDILDVLSPSEKGNTLPNETEIECLYELLKRCGGKLQKLNHKRMDDYCSHLKRISEYDQYKKGFMKQHYTLKFIQNLKQNQWNYQ